MKPKTIKLIILAAVLAVLVFALAACGGNPLTEEQLDEMGYSVIVKYDFNGGLNSDSLGEVTIRVRKDARIPEPGSKGASFGAPSKAQSSLRGFYLGRETETGIVYRDEMWDFSKDTVTENVTLYALWWDNFVVKVHCDDQSADRTVDFAISRDKATGEADTVHAEFFSTTGLGMSNRTIIGYYTDEGYTEELTFPRKLDFTDDANGRQIDIYVKSVAGAWTVIDSAERFAKGFSFNDNIYLKTDVDLEGMDVNLPNNYGGVFEGNGKTISNLTVNRTVANTDSGTLYLGLFCTVQNWSNVKNVNFENVEVNVTLSQSNRIIGYYIGSFAGRIEEKATVENVTVSGKLVYNLNGSTVVPVVGEFAGLNSATLNNCDYDNVTVESK